MRYLQRSSKSTHHNLNRLNNRKLKRKNLQENLCKMTENLMKRNKDFKISANLLILNAQPTSLRFVSSTYNKIVHDIATNNDWLMVVCSAISSNEVSREGTIEVTRFKRILKALHLEISINDLWELAKIMKLEFLDMETKKFFFYKLLKNLREKVLPKQEPEINFAPSETDDFYFDAGDDQFTDENAQATQENEKQDDYTP
jgi:hypothetical protein